MAFLPERNFLEETLVSNYDLSNGPTGFTTSDISEFNTLSLQFIYTDVTGTNLFVLEQSNDNTNWSELSETYSLPVGGGNFIIDKGTFSGKYLKIEITTTTSGNLTIISLTKR
jgi:hypothetical protein